MTQDTLTPRKTQKFMFDSHNFDLGDGDAAPVYTQEQLAGAKQDAYVQGKKDGILEAHASFEKQTADLLSAIRDHFSILFDEEDRRARTFEKESIQLAYTIFAKAFPALNQKFGLEEVKDAVRSVLETVHEQPEIIVEVPQDSVAVIQKYIEGLLLQSGGPQTSSPRCTVRGHDNLGHGQCRMAWTNGQAMRDGPALAEQMRKQIEQILADKAGLADTVKEAIEPTPPTISDSS